MSRNEKEVDIAKKAFELGIMYCMIKSGRVISGTMPETHDEAVEYMLKYAVDQNIDKECLNCGRYKKESCKGVPDRERKEINKHNRCAAFYEASKEG